MTDKLFTPLKIGKALAKNRIFMAPMSRYRATENGTPTDLTEKYYQQRASAGLIVAESTSINDWSGALYNPGLYRPEHVPAWKKVTDSVHAEGGLIFVQLWHSGRATHGDNLPNNRQVVSASAVQSQQDVMTASGMVKPPVPKALSIEEISELRQDFANAAKLAKEAGFDGVEIHGAGGFLIDAFLQTDTNLRTDAYGGSAENRFRFLKEIVEDAIDIWGPDGVAVKLSPTSAYNDMAKGDVVDTFSPVYKALDKYGLAFLEINEEMPFAQAHSNNREVLDELHQHWTGTYIANGNYDASSAEAAIESGKVDAVTFGRFFIANPDLPHRLETGIELAMPDMETLYGGDEKGYTDYPAAN